MKGHILLSKIGSKNWKLLIVPRVVFASLRYLEISLTKNRQTLDAYNFFSYQTLPGFSTLNYSLDLPLLV